MTNEERVRRLVDGELDPAESAAVLAEAERDPALAALLDDAATVRSALSMLDESEALPPPDDLIERSVRRAIADRERAEREMRGPRVWMHALRKPLTFRVRPITAIAVVCALAAAAILGVTLRPRQEPLERSHERGAGAPIARGSTNERPPDDDGQVPVRFVLPANGARSVSVAGDFNGWKTDVTALRDEDGDGVFVGVIDLPRGSYAYMFVVDGREWVTDPFAASFQDDGFGNQNAVLRL